ncbi:MAG: hypothetical protein FJZ38_13750 [Candidatus Rokubacteria bacterium]|nr:hypothetical protein [Candidatus Rokubacteria bacterium]
MRHVRSRYAVRAVLLLVVACAAAGVLDPCPAAAQFTIGGRKVAPQESNFAGVRHSSPRYGVVVQLNHDARVNGPFELTLVDDTYASLLRQHTKPAVPIDALPLVFVSDAKMARFGEGGRRRIFRWLESDLRKHPDVHVSPAAIFVSDENLDDRQKLQSALSRAMAFYFNPRFREALDGVERPTPDR